MFEGEFMSRRVFLAIFLVFISLLAVSVASASDIDSTHYTNHSLNNIGNINIIVDNHSSELGALSENFKESSSNSSIGGGEV